MEDKNRLEKIADYIIYNHNRKTHSKDFSAMFCVDSVRSLIRYYGIFKRKKKAGEHKLNIATIFSYAVNGDDADANGFIPEEVSVVEDEPRALYGLRAHSREYIEEYNQLYDVKYSTKSSEDFTTTIMIFQKS